MDDLISRQAAIDALEKVAELFPWRIPGNRDSYDRYNEAWNDAIGRAEKETSYVVCNRCGSRGEFFIVSPKYASAVRAVEAWNRRASDGSLH